MNRVWLVTVFFFVSGCAPKPPANEVPDAVAGLFESFNQHNPQAMMAFVTEDVEWLSVDGQEVGVETTGRAELESAMQDYFDGIPDVQTTIEAIITAGDYLAIRERSSWPTEEGTKTAAALAVYQIDDGKVRRLWYFPGYE